MKISEQIPDSVNLGHSLETAVMLELERRHSLSAYVRTQDGFEVDFITTDQQGNWSLIQMCAGISDSATREHEVRALAAAVKENPEARPILLTLDAVPPQPNLPDPLIWMPAARWFLEGF